MSEAVKQVSERDLVLVQKAQGRLEKARAVFAQAQIEVLHAEGGMQTVEAMLKETYALADGDLVSATGEITRKATDLEQGQ